MENETTTPTIWQALNQWAQKLKPWQRQIVAFAIQQGRLSSEQVETLYALFQEEHGLATKKHHDPIALDVSGRPADALLEKFRLERLDELAGINALPPGAALTFGPALTIIYGRNGAGKSGFARVFANACFSRHKPSILCNIYEESIQPEPAARFSFSLDGNRQKPITFAVGKDIPELKRLSFFDTTVARLHISQAAPLNSGHPASTFFPKWHASMRCYRGSSTRTADPGQVSAGFRTHSSARRPPFRKPLLLSTPQITISPNYAN